MKNWFIDRKFRIPRIWSNRELARFAPLFTGSVINVSAWKDEDKEGRRYRDYFTSASSYHISNFVAEARGFQGGENEVFLDLTGPLPADFSRAFDCVFNHTTLEHIYEVHKAFANLCEMSRDAVIVVVPFLQQMHAEYGDFWRFTPTTLERMFKENGFTPIHTAFNNEFMASVYVLMVAVRDPKAWHSRLPGNSLSDGTVPFGAETKWPDPFDHFVGCNAVPSVSSGIVYWLRRRIKPSSFADRGNSVDK